MPADEFDSLMSGEKPFNSAWESALMACESLHLITENLKTMANLRITNEKIIQNVEVMRLDVGEYKQNVTRRVSDVLASTPFILRPIKSKHNLLNGNNIQKTPKAPAPAPTPLALPKPLMPIVAGANGGSGGGGGHFQANLMSAMITTTDNKTNKMNSVPFVDGAASGTVAAAATKPIDEPDMANLAMNLTETLQIDDLRGAGATATGNTLSTSNSADLLSASPIFNYSPFDTHSLDELATPDEFAPINFIHGLTNINYDFDLSDYSAENSVADDVATVDDDTGNSVQRNLNNSSFTKLNLDEFDPLLERIDETDQSSPPHQTAKPPLNFQMGANTSGSLMDDSPNEFLLPSPLKPTVTDYRGFSSYDIPTIACNTGDFSSLNFQASTSRACGAGAAGGPPPPPQPSKVGDDDDNK